MPTSVSIEAATKGTTRWRTEGLSAVRLIRSESEKASAESPCGGDASV